MASQAVSEIVAKFRCEHGLCAYCGTALYKVYQSPSTGLKELEPLTVEGIVTSGRCLFCYPDPEPAVLEPPSSAAVLNAGVVDDSNTVATAHSVVAAAEPVVPDPATVRSSEVIPPSTAAFVTPTRASESSEREETESTEESMKSIVDTPIAETPVVFSDRAKRRREEEEENKKGSRWSAARLDSSRKNQRTNSDDNRKPAARPVFSRKNQDKDRDDDNRKPAAKTAHEETPLDETAQKHQAIITDEDTAVSYTIVTPGFRQIIEANEELAKEKQDKEEDEFSISTADSLTGKLELTIRDGNGVQFHGHVLKGTARRGYGVFKHFHDEDGDSAGDKDKNKSKGNADVNEKGIISIYKGEFASKKFHGKGKQLSGHCGTVYSGEFVSGFAHGKGRCLWRSGWMYTGQWKRDARCGYGEHIQRGLEQGEEYRGEWRDDVWNGQGELKFAQGGRYVGKFKDNEIHGSGKYEFADGSVYEGRFVNGLRVGYGEMSYAPDGLLYKGHWQGNVREGSGILEFPDGRHFEGSFRDDEMWFGFMTSPDDTLVKYVNGVAQNNNVGKE